MSNTKKTKKQLKKSTPVRTTKTEEIDYDEFNKNPLKIDDTPRNVARSFFGIRSDKFDKSQS